MPEALARFKEGLAVKVSCYEKGCEKVKLPVTLGRKDFVHPSFIRGDGVGRLRWHPNAIAKSFILSKKNGGSGDCRCPNCNKLFGKVIVISNGISRRATIFGYEHGGC